MADNISARRQKRIVFSTGSDCQSIELGCSAIDDGLLRHFPGPTLAILIYLLTHLEEDQTVQTNPAIIASYLPLEYDLEEIRGGLEELNERGMIELSSRREGNYTYCIRVNLEKISGETAPGGEAPAEEFAAGYKDRNTPSSSREELEISLRAFFPEGSAADRVEQWLADFEPAVLRELVRRVDKWRQNTGNRPDKAAPYLLGIVDDWYRKEVFSYQRLQHFDRLYRETKELAESYGIKDWHNLNPTQLETFRGWLSDKNPLSLPVARLAIREAVRRKKDGQPSLKYIEDNFIRPWKKAGVKDTAEAREFLRNYRTGGYARTDRRGPESRPLKREPVSDRKAIESWEMLDWEKGGTVDGY